ncbi:MAG: PaaI family thioesterase [Candidatus Competibacterales bacterium]
MTQPTRQSLDPLESGFNQLVGLCLVAWREGHAEVALTAKAHHLNRSGVLHGGVLTTLIDVACGFAGCYSPPDGPIRRAVTLSLTTSFTGPGGLGDLKAVAAVHSSGRRIFFATAEVVDAAGNALGFGQGTYRYINEVS